MEELLNKFHYELARCRNRKDYKLLESKYLQKIKSLPNDEQIIAKEEIQSTIKFSQ